MVVQISKIDCQEKILNCTSKTPFKSMSKLKNNASVHIIITVLTVASRCIESRAITTRTVIIICTEAFF